MVAVKISISKFNANLAPIRCREVYWVILDPTVGSEIKKTRRALVVSPDDMNLKLPRIIVAPPTSADQALDCRPEVRFKGKRPRILLDQLRCVDNVRLVGELGQIDAAIWRPVLMQMLA